MNFFEPKLIAQQTIQIYFLLLFFGLSSVIFKFESTLFNFSSYPEIPNSPNASSVEQGIPVYFSSLFSKLRPKLDNIVLVDNGQKINLGNLSITCIQTPGHSPCGVAYHVGKHLIAGDTLFVDGCGRCDFEQSNVEDMYDSIHNKLMVLPDDTIIYPGHHYGNKPFDTLENQRNTNRFMNCGTKEKFIRLRMGF